MRFKEFLMSEDGVSPKHLSAGKMSLDEMVDWIQNNASSFVNTNNLIFRGIQSMDAEGLYNGAQLKRTAANTHNYANLWFSNSHDWAKYPPRNKSFICSTSKGYTDSYGAPYIVIPADNSMIGVCPDQDLWDSFPEIRKITRMGMDDFMKIIDALTRLHDQGDFKNDWDHFAAYLNKVDVDMLKQALGDYERISQNRVWVESLIEYMEKKQLETLYQVFEYVFDPRRNGFNLERADAFSGPEDREVWMTGSVLMVQTETWRKLKVKLDLDF